MSIRNINKDHQKEHAEVELVTVEHLALPNHDDPLKFWTHHATQNKLIDLTVFAQGELTRPRGGGCWSGSFTGRPKLIMQLTPAIEAATFGCSIGSAQAMISSLRFWWRLFDSVEQAAAEAGEPMTRIEDVRQLTHVHLDFVKRSSNARGSFYKFCSITNATLKSLGAPALYWAAPERTEPKRHLPSEDQIKMIRIALKQEWESVSRRWALLDKVRTEEFEPHTDEEFKLLKQWQHYSQVQKTSGKVSPTSDELYGRLNKGSFQSSTGFTLTELRNSIFPNQWEIEAAFHLCLANTGWNPAVLYSLDTSQTFLCSHPRDPVRYLLTGNKARAGGKEQMVTGLWKTKSGPGFIIKKLLERIAPLREQMKTMLASEHSRYAQMVRDGALADKLTRQVTIIQDLETGSRNVWLYIDCVGQISWISKSPSKKIWHNGKQSTYIKLLLERLNSERAVRAETPIAFVVASDFRDMFALYVWRKTGGNILAVMRALNHAYLRTTQDYIDNNILNAERDQQTRNFLDHLFNELGAGRLDITILAHLQRYGVVSREMEQRLESFRSQQRSRMGVACQDPFHPPPDIQPQSASKQICSSQRCLICKSHAVILPESLSGIAMRVEELEAMQAVLPIGIWLQSRFPEEMRNGLDVFRLFPHDDVRKAREYWAHAIAIGSHHIPGIHSLGNMSKAA